MSTAYRTRPRAVPMTSAQEAAIRKEGGKTLATANAILREAARFEQARYAATIKSWEKFRLENLPIFVEAQLQAMEEEVKKLGLPPARGAKVSPVSRIDVKKLGRPAPTVEFERKSVPFQLKATTAGKSGSLKGYGAVFNNVDRVGDIIAPGAFRDSIREFIASGFVGGLGHNWDQPIASVKTATEDSRGLLIESGEIVDTQHGSDVLKLIRAGVIKKLSIGYRAISPRQISDPNEVEAYWKSVSYQPSANDRQMARRGVRLLHHVELLEVSPVAMPANAQADILGF